MITGSGLTIVEPLRLPYEGKTLEQSRDEQLPINVAYVLAKTETETRAEAEAEAEDQDEARTKATA
jgi:hypothetical protein